MKGKFVTFEGCEGVGKSRQLAMLKESLDERGIKYLFTREPGGTMVSEKIRDVILDSDNKTMTDECEALLYAAARAQLVKELILPSLQKGLLVICDRYIDSSFAYQSFARGLGVEFVKNVNSYAINNAVPDLTLFLNLDPKAAFSRKGGADKTDRVELSGMEFHQKVYGGYKKLVEADGGKRIASIDASGSKEQTHAKIIAELLKRGIIE